MERYKKAKGKLDRNLSKNLNTGWEYVARSASQGKIIMLMQKDQIYIVSKISQNFQSEKTVKLRQIKRLLYTNIYTED